jgi:cell division protein ZapD
MSSTAPLAPPPSLEQIFELPCSERVRTMMRLECISNRLEKLALASEASAHRAWLSSYLELFDLLSSRSDIKNELLQELERQRIQLERFVGQPGVASERLEAVLTEVTYLFETLGEVQMRLGPHVPEVEFLQSLKGRAGIPAGDCPFDLPVLSLWLTFSPEKRRVHMENWVAPVSAVLRSAQLCLRLLREVAEPQEMTAEDGLFEMNPGGRQAKLIRVWAPAGRGLICDMSANKYVVAVRFRAVNERLQPQPFQGSLRFRLAICEF